MACLVYSHLEPWGRQNYTCSIRWAYRTVRTSCVIEGRTEQLLITPPGAVRQCLQGAIQANRSSLISVSANLNPLPGQKYDEPDSERSNDEKPSTHMHERPPPMNVILQLAVSTGLRGREIKTRTCVSIPRVNKLQ
jgi:hypothetical protein